MEVLIFELGTQRYGLPASQTIEVLRACTIMPLPKAPAIIEGAIDVRGSVIPVLDIRSRFRLQPKPLSVSDQFVVAETAGRTVAIRADRAIDLANILESELRTLNHLAGHRDYIAGVASLPDGIVLIHDLDAFLSESESLSLARSLEGLANE